MTGHAPLCVFVSNGPRALLERHDVYSAFRVFRVRHRQSRRVGYARLRGGSAVLVPVGRAF